MEVDSTVPIHTETSPPWQYWQTPTVDCYLKRISCSILVETPTHQRFRKSSIRYKGTRNLSKRQQDRKINICMETKAKWTYSQTTPITLETDDGARYLHELIDGCKDDDPTTCRITCCEIT